jgi:hypothetical protein
MAATLDRFLVKSAVPLCQSEPEARPDDANAMETDNDDDDDADDASPSGLWKQWALRPPRHQRPHGVASVWALVAERELYGRLAHDVRPAHLPPASSPLRSPLSPVAVQTELSAPRPRPRPTPR